MLLTREKTSFNPVQQNREKAGHFIRLCINARFNAASLPLEQTITTWQESDWEDFLAEARAEKLQPLLYEELAGQHMLPVAVEETLKSEYQYTARRNLYLLHELQDVIDRLSQAGIGAVMLKGAALIESVYNNIGVRPMLDLDLLIREEQAPQVLQLLIDEGYCQDVEPHSGSALLFENEQLLIKPGIEPVPLEIHWHLFDSPYYQQQLDLDWFWEQTTPLKSADKTVLLFTPEAQLLHLFGHLALHHAAKPAILWLIDLAEVLTSYQEQIDWDLVLQKAVEYQLVRSLQWGTDQLAAFFLRSPIPSDIVEKIRALPVDPSETLVFSWHNQPDRSVADFVWSDVALLPGWRQKTRFLFVKLFPSPAYMRSRYEIPSPYQVPLYYLWHWLIGLSSSLAMLISLFVTRAKRV